MSEPPDRALLAARPTPAVDERTGQARLSVCMLITDFDGGGGIKRQSELLIGRLREQGVDVVRVLSRNYAGLPRHDERRGVWIRRSPTFGRARRALNAISYLVDGLAWLVRNRRQYDVIHCQEMFGSAMLALCARALLRKPVLVRVTITGEPGEVRNIQRMPFARLRIRQLRGVDRWIALTTEMKREICSLDIPPERVSIVPNGSDLPERPAYAPGVRAGARARLGLEHPQTAVFTGRLSRQKGLDTLLRAWKALHLRFPDAHLLLVGGGGDYLNVEAELRALSDELDLGRVVHFVGHVAEVRDYLLAADLFVLPTRAEGMSNSLVEAMGAGLPIVATDIPANHDILSDEENALLARVDDHEGLAAAMTRILEGPELAARLGEAARARAERDLSADTMTSRYLDVYRALLGR